MKNKFKDDTDRDDFIDRLSIILPETATSCFAWSLMRNHVHLLFRTGKAPIATVMNGYI
jgi:REP-associated tyrosine transposase